MNELYITYGIVSFIIIYYVFLQDRKRLRDKRSWQEYCKKSDKDTETAKKLVAFMQEPASPDLLRGFKK